ncbi:MULTISPECIES: tRNA pseudouridine(38-40) synthase TruA [Glycomyces]|uniref:tRNA pseudouridine synthase A n=2 Tax=Glycomyces TaxID=58113 RepID=A0A9X3PFY6_9ACTN|nr:tRNA pseudouridine(38-40) synthase TruA [Glycomyces lechevalierae]MDA1384804.1 tRNA pseudouridine(38-40) synthase TruA [Glycomyces lechevalierae]MDR7337744.1 tRNA pseudouridine38-40 synthase [Glycomyces lechevalierae]
MDEVVDKTRLRLGVAYDGAAFSGWALQPGLRTVASEVIRALELLFGEIADFTVAGRTDAGVHATGQVVHVDVPTAKWEAVGEKLLWRLRGILPADVRATSVEAVDPSFNARFAAQWRRYRYRVADATWGVNPLRRLDTLAWQRPIDVERMHAACQRLIGEHDFVGFCKQREGATTIRELHQYDWARDEDGVAVATVRADAFCHSMVRSLVGAALAVGDGRRDEEWLASILTIGQRANDVHVVGPHGLTLLEVSYSEDPKDWQARVDLTRRVRTR